MASQSADAKASLRFLGAAGTVTGSRTLLTVGPRRYLVDCGLFQGDKATRDRNWDDLGVAADAVDGIILTHAHLDHSGYLPRLYRNGYRGKVFCSEGTADLCRVLLLDAAHLEEEAADFANRTGYSNHKPAKPLFETPDALGALGLFEPKPRDEWVELGGGVSFRFVRAGHIVGASLVQVALSQGQRTRFVTFSGDVGHDRSVVLKGPEELPETNDLILESTYGDRLHPRADVLTELATIVNRTATRGGVLVVPAFAVGRAQEVLQLLRMLEDDGKIPTLPVILDSPMSAAATEILLGHSEDHKLDYTFAREDGVRSFGPARLEIAKTPDESMLACMRDGPMIVLSAAGMLTGGRILHHLKARLPHDENTVLFAGYQVEGSKGRFLQDNATTAGTLRIHHQEVEIAAEIVTLPALSAHADYEDLIAWLARARRLPERILINHGSPAASRSLAEKISAQVGCEAVVVDGETDYSLDHFRSKAAV